MLSRWPTWRRIALTTVLCLAVALTITALVQGLAPRGPLRVLEVLGIVLTGAATAGIAIGLIVARMANYQDPESEAEFEQARRSAPSGSRARTSPPSPTRASSWSSTRTTRSTSRSSSRRRSTTCRTC